MEGYRENTRADVKDGALTLQFKPYEVHLLASAKTAQQGRTLKSVETLHREMAAATKALPKPGNLLFGRRRDLKWEFSDTYTPLFLGESLLTDGFVDTLAWRDQLSKEPARIEMSVPSGTLRFASAQIYGANVENLEFFAWQNDEWEKVGEGQGNGSVIRLEFPVAIETTKIKLLPKARAGAKVEIYEVELYQTPPAAN